MEDIFFQTDFRKIIKDSFRADQNRGYGQSSKLARFLGVNTTLISQILSSKRKMTEEQAAKTTEFLGFNRKEAYYFILLVQLDRTSDVVLKNIFSDQLEKIRQEAKSIKGRVSPQAELTLDQQIHYYSNWIFSVVHTAVTIEHLRDTNAIADHLKLPKSVVSSVIEVLESYGLILSKNGKLFSGPKTTYLPPDSVLVQKHHQNWRQVSAMQMHLKKPDDFYFTAPMSISAEDYQIFRKKLVELISSLYKIVEGTRPQELACINIDFFKI